MTAERVPFLGWWLIETVSELIPDPKSTWIAERDDLYFSVTARCGQMMVGRVERLELARAAALGAIRAKLFLGRWTAETDYEFRLPCAPSPVTSEDDVRSEMLTGLRTAAAMGLQRGSYYVDLDGVATELGVSREALVFELEYLEDEGCIGDPQTSTSNLRNGCMWITSRGIDALANQLPTPLPQALHAVLFTDIVGSTELTERLGDTAYAELARPVLDAARLAVANSGGVCMKGRALGDGILAIFPAAAHAIECALQIATTGAAMALPVRTGVHVGDVTRESDDVTGGTVNLAARIASAAEPGEVLVSTTAKECCYTSANVVFSPRPTPPMKGISAPPNIFAVKRPTEGET